MIPRRARQTAVLAAAAAALLAALGFLFAKTQSSGYKEDMHAMALLRELRDMDARWDADALRIAREVSAAGVAIADRGPVIERILRELARGPQEGVLQGQVAALRTGMAQRQAAFRTLRDAHAASLQAVEAARGELAAIDRIAAARRSLDGSAAAGLLGIVGELRSGLRSADIERHAQLIRSLEPQLATLEPAARQLDPALADRARAAEASVREYLVAREAEAQAWRRFSFLTAGSRAEMLHRSLAASLESALGEKDRWRAYLLAYALALLIVVGHLALRVAATQAQLREANRDLEKRVAARTAELERALVQLKESEAQLVQTEKMSSLGQLVAGVAHEVNTPLAYVKNSVATVRDRMPELRATLAEAEKLLATLQSPAPDGEDLQQAFEALSNRLVQLEAHQVMNDLESLTRDGLHGIEQIAELVGNLRSFSRLDRSRVASFNVNDGVGATLLIARSALRLVDVERRLADVPAITCSPSQVNQVILNLVTNAAQAIDKPRGRIELATRREGVDFVAIEVSDNGRGIAPDALPRVFDPFYTTKEAGKGTGLGLSIAYKIVSQHGGRIDVRSELGAGSTFTVTLPIRPPAEIHERAEAAEPVA
jgi:two-component system, NtrC family, sensor kinase